MHITYYIWFATKHEKTVFLNTLRECESRTQAVHKLMTLLPDASLEAIDKVLDSFEKEIGKNIKK